jgi:hypothetical protein
MGVLAAVSAPASLSIGGCMPTVNTSYLTIEALRALSDADFAALWEAVPTDRQAYYQRMYTAELNRAQAGTSDLAEFDALSKLIASYQATGLIPLGDYWLATPERIQERVRNGATSDLPDTKSAKVEPKRVSPLLYIGAAGIAVVMVVITGARLSSVGKPITPVAAARTLTATVTPLRSSTPLLTPTATPLALENQDAIIRGGTDRTYGSITAYPISLRVFPTDNSQPRVFVVQRKVIDTAEWQFDPNPDTASYIAGLSARPVLGIPYSEENAALFDQFGAASALTLQLNTGATLRFRFISQNSVHRSETSAFRQAETGLILALIGQRDESGAPTAIRRMISAIYAPEQEVSADGALVSLNGTLLPTVTPAPTATPVERLDVQLISVHTTPGYLKAQLRIVNHRLSPIVFTPDSIWLALGYSPLPIEPRIPAEGLTPFTLLPSQAADVSILWVYIGEPFALLGVNDYLYSVEF